MNCRIYIFKQVIFPHCNIQNLDLHTGPAGSSMRGLAGYPDCWFTLPFPGEGVVGRVTAELHFYVMLQLLSSLSWSGALQVFILTTHTYKLLRSPPTWIFLLK